MKKKITCIALALVLIFSIPIIWVHIVPVKVDPTEVTVCSCTVDDTQISINPTGYDDPISRKAWKITTRYDEDTNTLYVTCWLKQSLTYSGFDYESGKIDRAEFDEIDRVVLVGGLFGQKKLTVWENGSAALP